MPKGYKHTEQTKLEISKSAKGKGKGGFNVKIECPICCQIMSPANLGKHEIRCRESRGLILNGKELSVKEIKVLKKRLKSYSITVEEYVKMHTEQNDLCKICIKPNSKRYGRLSVDHCHKTNKVRGLRSGICEVGDFGDEIFNRSTNTPILHIPC